MARVSNSPLDEKTYRQVLDTLDLVLGKLKKEEVRKFLFSLLGKNERIMVSKRFVAVLLLSQGMKVSDISKKLNLTHQTVRRMLLIKETKKEGFNLAVNKLSKELVLKEVNKILVGLGKGSAELFLKYRVKPPSEK